MKNENQVIEKQGNKASSSAIFNRMQNDIKSESVYEAKRTLEAIMCVTNHKLLQDVIIANKKEER